ncbi:Protein YqjC [compost metagenome]
MKRHLPLPFVLLAGALLAQPVAATETGCAAKRQAIEQRIEAAKAHGNSAQQAGLEKALAEVKTHCTDAGLRQEREAKIAEYQAEVRQREADLREAQAKGDPAKIAKRQAKLEEARAELDAAEKALER